MFVSVIIPTYNRAKSLEKTVLNILKGRFPADHYEIIVCDDGSTDETRDILGALLKKFSHIRQIVLEHTGNPASARNRGIKEARGEVIAFTDDDTFPDENWLENGVKRFEKEDIAGVEGYICTDKILIRNWYAPVKDRRKPEDDEKSWYGYFSGNMFYRRSVLVSIGGFDERFQTNEDIDLAWRAAEKGHIPFDESVSVFHFPKKMNKSDWKAFMKKRRIYDALLFQKHPRLFPEMFRRVFPYQKQTLGGARYLACLLQGAFILKVCPPFYRLIPFLFTYYSREFLRFLHRIKNRVKRRFA